MASSSLSHLRSVVGRRSLLFRRSMASSSSSSPALNRSAGHGALLDKKKKKASPAEEEMFRTLGELTKLEGAEKEEMLRTMREWDSKMEKEIAANLDTIKALDTFQTETENCFLYRSLGFLGVPNGEYGLKLMRRTNLAAIFCASFAVSLWSTEKLINITQRQSSPENIIAQAQSSSPDENSNMPC